MNNSIVYENSGKLIKEIRMTKNITQNEFSKNILDISRRHLIRIENGECEVTLSMILHLIKNLDIDIDYIFTFFEYGEDYLKLSQKLKNIIAFPPINIEELSEIIDIIYEYHYANLQHSEQKYIDYISTAITYYNTDSIDTLKYHYLKVSNKSIINGNDISVLTLQSLILSTNKKKEVIELLLKFIEKCFEKSKIENSLKCIINTIGLILLENDSNINHNIFFKTESLIFSNKLYYLLPIFYFHFSKYYYLKNNYEKFTEFKNESLLFSRKLRLESTTINLLKEFYDLNKFSKNY